MPRPKEHFTQTKHFAPKTPLPPDLYQTVPVALPYITANLRMIVPHEDDNKPVKVACKENKKFRSILKGCEKPVMVVKNQFIPDYLWLTEPPTTEPLAPPNMTWTAAPGMDELLFEQEKVMKIHFCELVDVQTYNCRIIPKRSTPMYWEETKGDHREQKEEWRNICTAAGFTYVTRRSEEVYKEQFMHAAWNEPFKMIHLVKHIKEKIFPAPDNPQYCNLTGVTFKMSSLSLPATKVTSDDRDKPTCNWWPQADCQCDCTNNGSDESSAPTVGNKRKRPPMHFQ